MAVTLESGDTGCGGASGGWFWWQRQRQRGRGRGSRAALSVCGSDTNHSEPPGPYKMGGCNLCRTNSTVYKMGGVTSAEPPNPYKMGGGGDPPFSYKKTVSYGGYPTPFHKAYLEGDGLYGNPLKA